MLRWHTWQVDQCKTLSRRELKIVLEDLRRRAERSVSEQLNLVLVRLACCGGLRASEIAGLQLRDVCVGPYRPIVHVRKEVAKGGRGRSVPLWWDAGTLQDIAAWKALRQSQGAQPDDLFLATVQRGRCGRPLTRHGLRHRFFTACRCLGPDRVARLTIHHGRHTFISHALAGGRTLAEVRDAAGHSHVGTTSIYVHLAVDDDETPGDLFRF